MIAVPPAQKQIRPVRPLRRCRRGRYLVRLGVRLGAGGYIVISSAGGTKQPGSVGRGPQSANQNWPPLLTQLLNAGLPAVGRIGQLAEAHPSICESLPLQHALRSCLFWCSDLWNTVLRCETRLGPAQPVRLGERVAIPSAARQTLAARNTPRCASSASGDRRSQQTFRASTASCRIDGQQRPCRSA